MLIFAFSFFAAKARQEYFLRMVTCVIRPEQLDEVAAVLNRQDIIVGMTVTNVRGFGRQGPELKPKLKLEVLVRRKDVDPVVEAIVKTLRTGEIGDGKIVIYDAAHAMRVRTGEKGRDAL